MPPRVVSEGGKVLVVDDEEAVRDFLAAALPHLGFEPVLADGGERALAIVREQGAQLTGVILDVTMPGMSGEQVYTELRRLDGDLPVLVSSGFSGDDIASRFPGKGLAGFIQKPYRLSELSEKLALFTEE